MYLIFPPPKFPEIQNFADDILFTSVGEDIEEYLSAEK